MRLYGLQRWRRKAKAQIDAEPLCRACKAQGRITPAKVADHIVPCGADEDAFWEGELQSLCNDHHQAKRQAERDGRTWAPHRSGAQADGTPVDPSHPWNR